MGGRLALEGAAHGPGLVASVWLPLADPPPLDAVGRRPPSLQ